MGSRKVSTVVKSLKIPARSLLVAPRLPARPKDYLTMFTSLGKVLISCENVECDWLYTGSRLEAKAAITEHNRLAHSDQDEAHVVMINKPRQ